MSKKFWLGLALIVISYGQWLLPKQLFVTHHFLAGFFLTEFVTVFYLGIILVCGGISKKFGGVSLFGTARRHGGNKGLLTLIVAAGISGILLDVFAQWMGKLWIYPFFFTWLYWLIVFPGFVFYWVTIVKSYMAVKAMLDARWKPKSNLSTAPYYPVERFIYPFLGATGAVMIVRAVYKMLWGYHTHGGYIFEVVHKVGYAPAFVWPIVGLGGVYFVAEWVLYLRKAPSFIRGLIHGYWVPLAAILIASVVLSFFMETQNVMHGHWIYTHWPGANVKFAGVQAMVYLVWPLHYLLFLSVPGVFAALWAKIFWGERTTLKK